MTNILISIKPKYSQQIFAGTKTIELRRTFPKLQKNTTAYVYESTPTKAIVGKFNISLSCQFSASQVSLETFWMGNQKEMGVKEIDFFKYYEGAKIFTALFIESPVLFKQPFLLQDLRLFHAPPQSFCYLDNELEELLVSR